MATILKLCTQPEQTVVSNQLFPVYSAGWLSIGMHTVDRHG